MQLYQNAGINMLKYRIPGIDMQKSPKPEIAKLYSLIKLCSTPLHTAHLNVSYGIAKRGTGGACTYIHHRHTPYTSVADIHANRVTRSRISVNSCRLRFSDDNGFAILKFYRCGLSSCRRSVYFWFPGRA